jgi:hypothetical protein
LPCTELEWHLQLWIDTRDLPDLLPALAKVTVPVVVDHMGRMEHRHGTSHPGFQALLRGVGEGRLWSKLSGTYRLGATAPDYEEAPPFHDALVAANPPILSAGPGRKRGAAARRFSQVDDARSLHHSKFCNMDSRTNFGISARSPLP